MKSIVLVAFALVAIAAAVPVEQKEVEVITSELVQNADGSYNTKTELTDGSKRQEEGQLKEVKDEENKPHLVVVVRGNYEYVNPDGTKENVNYYADETGYHAEGPSVPKAQQ